VIRLAALGLVLFAVYAAGIGVEPRLPDDPYLRTAEALVDGDGLVRGPWGAGFPLLIAPAEALGGARAVELFLAAVAALGFVLAALLARRIVPEPYASAGAALAGLSAPAIAHAAAIQPEATAGTLLAAGALAAVGAREQPRIAPVLGGAAALSLLPWLSPWLALPALPVGAALYVWCRRARHPTLGLIAVEVVAASVVLYATLNERLYGGPTPFSALPSGASATGAGSLVEHVERTPRLVQLWLDPGPGLLRWAPVYALVFYAALLLWRSHRERLARVVPARATAEAAAGLALAVVGAVLLVAAFLAPSIDQEPFAARHLAPAFPAAAALIAWGLRHAPRTGAVLGALTLAASVSFFVG
jgi:hypothetical protein